VNTPSIRSRLTAAIVAFLLGFGIANYGVIVVPAPDLWLWLVVSVVLMGTGVVGVLVADSTRDVSLWAVIGAELFAVFTVIPLLWVFSVATTPAGEVRTTLWPSQISFAAFDEARSGVVLAAAGASLLIAGLATVAAMAVAIPAAVGLVRRRLPGRRIAYGVVVAALVAPTVVLAAPAAAQLLALDLADSRLAMVVPTLAVSLPLAIWLAVRVLRAAPWSLHAAMRADGADRRQVLRRFALPYLALDLLLVTVMVFYWTAGDLALGAGMAATQDTRPLPATLLLLSGRGELSSQVVAAAGLWWLVPAALVLIVFSRRIAALLGRP
jgi:ABC-type glycerol-3-phosphate transport system permease component